MSLDHALAWDANPVNIALSKAFKTENVQEVILGHTSYWRTVSGEGHANLCADKSQGSLEPKDFD